MCRMMISVEATTINMIQVPKLNIKEGQIAEFICVTDSAYPQPPVVSWLVNDEHVNENVGHVIVVTQPGEYQGQKTKSTLILIAKRAMNNKKVKCTLGNDTMKFNEHSLNVVCKYLFITSDVFSFIHSFLYGVKLLPLI